MVIPTKSPWATNQAGVCRAAIDTQVWRRFSLISGKNQTTYFGAVPLLQKARVCSGMDRAGTCLALCHPCARFFNLEVRAL